MEDVWKQRASAAMDRYADGDDAAFSDLYDLLAPRLSSFLQRRTRDEAKTEDLVQQTFLQMHHARRHFEKGASVTAWAYAIARRLLIDTYRKSGREYLETAEEPEGHERICPDALPDTALAHSRLTRLVEQELRKVADTNRVAFDLVYRDGLTAPEAAPAAAPRISGLSGSMPRNP